MPSTSKSRKRFITVSFRDLDTCDRLHDAIAAKGTKAKAVPEIGEYMHKRQLHFKSSSLT
jgi:hypothetical protein